jgi:hypothetical protein
MHVEEPIVQQIAEDGFAILPAVLGATECDALADHVAGGASASGGTRKVLQHAWCRALAGQLRQHPLLSPLLSLDMVAMQCTYFEKSAARNWLVPLHQDLSIPVAHRVDHPSLGPWSEKEGALFVQPPCALLQQLIAVRVHIDACTANDGALRVLAGSHRLGMLGTEAATAARQTHTEQLCTLERGGVLMMRPLLLHASSKSTGSSQRRVLHFLFGPATPPLGLQWQDAV